MAAEPRWHQSPLPQARRRRCRRSRRRRRYSAPPRSCRQARFCLLWMWVSICCRSGCRFISEWECRDWLAAEFAPPSAVCRPHWQPTALSTPLSAFLPAAAAAAAAASSSGPRRARQQQQQAAAMAEPAAASLSPVDAVIDDVLGGDVLDRRSRAQLADEAAYKFFSAVRDAAGDALDSEAAAELNALVPIPAAEQDAIFARTDAVAARILRPLGHEILRLQGVDPATADADAARAALQAPLSAEQQQAVDGLLAQLYQQVYVPEVKAGLAQLGEEGLSADEVWRRFELEVAERAKPARSRSALVGSLPAAAVGALVALVASRLAGWLRGRRTRRRHGGSAYSDDEDAYHSGSLQEDEDEYEA